MNSQDKQSLELLYEGILSRFAAKADAVKPVVSDVLASTKDALKGNREAIQKRKEGKGSISQHHTVETVASLLKNYYFFLKDELKNCQEYVGEDPTYSETFAQLESLKAQIKDSYKNLKFGSEDGNVNIRHADEIAAEKSMKEARAKGAETRSKKAAKRNAIRTKNKAKEKAKKTKPKGE